MTNWISRIARRVSNKCIADRCDKDGCSVRTDQLPSDQLIIDLDCHETERHHGRNRCDYLIVAEDGRSSWVFPVELKSGRFQASSVVKQIQAGADQAKVLVPFRNSMNLVPILAHGSKHRINRKEFEYFERQLIKQFGMKKRVIVVRCGDDLGKRI